MQNSLIICIGPPSCGKTTWYENFKKNFKGTNGWINIEKMRSQLIGDENDYTQEELIEQSVESQLKTFLSLNIEAICWDNRSPTYKSRRKIIEYGKKANYRVIGILFDISLNTCIIRNKLRVNKLTDEYIEHIYNIMQENKPSSDEGFDDIIIIKES